MSARRSYLWLLAAALLVAAALVAAGCATGAAHERSTAGAGRADGATVTPSQRPTAKASPSTTSTKGSAASAGTPSGPPVTLVFVDVGQGDAIIVKAGSFDCLIDGGPSGEEGHLEAELRKARVARLDLLVVTHAHEDHIGDLAEVIRDFRPLRAVVDEGAPTATYCGVKRALAAVRTKVVRRFRGARLRLGVVRATVLSPGRLSGDANSDSVVLLLNVYRRRILLTGDTTGANEMVVGRLLARGPPLFILKVAHHGSATSTGYGFLANVRPRFAVIEVGVNDYGHPSARTIRRLKAVHARIFTTRKNGDIWVTIMPSGKAVWRFR